MAVVAQQHPVTDSGCESNRSRCTAGAQKDEPWKANLNLRFEKGKHKTLLRRDHTGPLMVQRPFYPEGHVCHTYMLHPPAGIVGGDHLCVTVDCGDDAHGLVTTPGANRYYGSDGRVAKQQQVIDVCDGSLEWFPGETIFFNQCVAEQTLQVQLKAQSRFIAWDILCFGRPAGDKHFNKGSVKSYLKVTVDQKPTLFERLCINSQTDIQRTTGLRGSTVVGTMLLMAPANNSDVLDYARSRLPVNEPFVITLIDQLFVVRYLGHSAEQAKAGFTTMWQTLRPAVLQREACVPRIWAT